MGKHILSLRVPEISTESVFMIDDTSTYDAILPISCPDLQILPPGYNTPSVIEGILPNFRLVLNACTLGIMGPTSCAEVCPNLPDGIYHIRYSVAPNTMVYVEYDHMRITHAMNRYNGLLCQVNLQPCLPDQDQIYQLQQLDLIRNYLITAKLLVEDQCKPDDGISIYRYADMLMNKMSTHRTFC